MKTFLHAQISAPAIPAEMFDHQDRLNQLHKVVESFSSTDDATFLGDEIGYGLVDDREYERPKQKNRDLTRLDNQHQISGHNHFKSFDADVLSWVHKNISPLAVDVRHSFSTPGRPTVGPHRDKTRDYTMIYLYTPGGTDHATVFYQEKGCEIERPVGYWINEYSQLTEISRIQIPLNTWTIINGRVLHSVENTPDIRSSIQISFNEFPEDLNFTHKIYHYQ
jgi:hypothetical protein